MSGKKSYEESIKRLEEIVESLSRNDVGLDDSLKLFEEGTELSAYCYNMLKNAETKVEELKNQEAINDSK
jgi:exodeoxyribonuclease VII small subunit